MRGGGVCGWLLVFFFLLAEVLVCTVMVLPIPLQMRCGFLMDLGNICSSAVVKTALITTFTIFFGLFLGRLALPLPVLRDRNPTRRPPLPGERADEFDHHPCHE